MKKLNLFFLLIFGISLLSAQDYAPLLAGRSYLFSTNKTYPDSIGLLGFHVDSTWINGTDRMFAPTKIPLYCRLSGNPNPFFDKGSLFPTVYPWLQESFSSDSTGNFTFYNEFQEAIYLKTRTQIGDSWILYSDSTGLEIHARHTSTQVQVVFDQLDSVKYIEFQAYDSLGLMVSNRWNGESIQLAKHNGLIKTIRIECFPRGIQNIDFLNLIRSGADTAMILYQLGATHPDVGRFPLASKHIYDFEVGDEIIVRKFLGVRENSTKTLERQRIIAKTVAGDTVQYSVEIKGRHVDFFGSDVTGYRPFAQNKSITVDLLEPAPLPYTRVTNPPLFTYHTNGIYGSIYVREVNGRRGLGLDYETGSIPCSWPGTPEEANYGIQGLGGPYYDIYGMGGYSSYRMPVYYKKGAEEWGTFYNIDSLYNAVGITNDVLPGISITHQPNILIIHQEQPQQLQFNLMNLTGQQIYTEQIKHTNHQVAITSLANGIYPYLITNEKGQVQTGKLLISQ